MKKNIAVVIFSRANYARIKSVLKEFLDPGNLLIPVVTPILGLIPNFLSVLKILEVKAYKVFLSISSIPCCRGL